MPNTANIYHNDNKNKEGQLFLTQTIFTFCLVTKYHY